MSRLRWLFARPARLYGAMAVAAAVMALFMVTVIGVRVSSLPEAPRSAEAGPVFPDDVVESTPTRGASQVALEAVEEREGVEVRDAVVEAADGLVQVVAVTTADGRTAEVVLLADGRSFVVDSVSWRTP